MPSCRLEVISQGTETTIEGKSTDALRIYEKPLRRNKMSSQRGTQGSSFQSLMFTTRQTKNDTDLQYKVSSPEKNLFLLEYLEKSYPAICMLPPSPCAFL